MSAAGINWDDAAADVSSYFNERQRSFDAKLMLAVIDDLALGETATQTKLLEKYHSADFLATVLGHVTTAIHGKGSVPAINGWYTSVGSPPIYRLNPDFAASWRAKRRLPRSE